MNTKPDFKQHVQFDKQRGGCGLGCCSIGCMGIIGALLVIGITGYYGLMHSSLPLQMIEAAIEDDGEVEIEGLTGSLASGFSADEIRFKTMNDHWSNLTNVKFKYESDSSLFGTERVVIEELSVDGGTIYAQWDPDKNELEFDSDISEELREIEDEIEEAEAEFREETGRSPRLRELKIDLVSVTNLKIINPETQLEITLDEIKFAGFKWEEGNLESLGELLVKSSQLELETVPSVAFADIKNAERFEGVLRSQVDHRLIADVPFVFDFAVDDDLSVSLQMELFDGQIKFQDDSNKTRLNYSDFSPADYIELKNGAVLPAHVNLELEYGDERKQGPTGVNADGSFQFGTVAFGDLKVAPSSGDRSVVLATGELDGKTVTARIKFDVPFSFRWIVILESEEFSTPEDVWAQTLFGNDFELIGEEQQQVVRASMLIPKVIAKDDPAPADEQPVTAEALPEVEKDPQSGNAKKYE